MINPVKAVLKKTLEIENQVEYLATESNSPKLESNCITFTKTMLNLNIRVRKIISLAEFEAKAGSSLYFQNHIEMNLTESHKVRFSLVVNGVYIYRSNKDLSAGYNNITIMKTYTPIIDETLEIFLVVEPAFGKEVLLSNETLAVWGLSQKNKVSNYQAIETPEYFLLSYLDGKQLFYTKVDKKIGGYLTDDFTFWGSVKSFSFVYNTQTNNLLLYYCDYNNNLFEYDFTALDYKLLGNEASAVSAVSNGQTTLICYVKNNSLYYFELDNFGNASTHKILDRISLHYISCYTLFNKYKNNFYIIGTDKNNSNYMFESSLEQHTKGLELSASINYQILTYGAQNEI